MKKLVALLRSPIGWPEEAELRDARTQAADLLEQYPPIPLAPRITKSTAVDKIKARFEKTSEMLKRFTVANGMASLWDGERDGLREAVKTIEAGQYDDVVLTKTDTAPVLYPNADGKHLLECCLQSTVPAPDGGLDGFVIAFNTPDAVRPAQFLDNILHHLQKSKESALEYLENNLIGVGEIRHNEDLYEKKGSTKNTIAVLPPNVTVS